MIYTASCLHAAVNFPQRPIMSYVPMTPASVYEAAPTDKVLESMLPWLCTTSVFTPSRTDELFFALYIVTRPCMIHPCDEWARTCTTMHCS